jgi:hypothetical protein
MFGSSSELFIHFSRPPKYPCLLSDGDVLTEVKNVGSARLLLISTDQQDRNERTYTSEVRDSSGQKELSWASVRTQRNRDGPILVDIFRTTHSANEGKGRGDYDLLDGVVGQKVSYIVLVPNCSSFSIICQTPNDLSISLVSWGSLEKGDSRRNHSSLMRLTGKL